MFSQSLKILASDISPEHGLQIKYVLKMPQFEEENETQLDRLIDSRPLFRCLCKYMYLHEPISGGIVMWTFWN